MKGSAMLPSLATKLEEPKTIVYLIEGLLLAHPGSSRRPLLSIYVVHSDFPSQRR